MVSKKEFPTCINCKQPCLIGFISNNNMTRASKGESSMLEVLTLGMLMWMVAWTFCLILKHGRSFIGHGLFGSIVG
jgi:hypothetical protein